MQKNIFKKFIVLSSLSFVLFGFNFVFAEGEDVTPPEVSVNIHLSIISGSNSLYNSDISVTACDSDNDINTPDTITAYCAILQSGVSNVWDWSWAPGAFVTSVGGINGYTSKDKDDADVYHYWSWSLNGSEAMLGLNQYDLKTNDSILLEFIDPIEVIPEVVIPEPRHGSSGSMVNFTNIIVTPEKTFLITNALDFLYKNQKDDKSYGAPMYTDWAAIAISLGDNQIVKSNLINHFKSNNINSSTLTDYERRAMALMSLGVNPYNGTDVNYIKRIIDSFDGTQFGDKELENDDIFALIVLKNAGYGVNDEVILKGIDYIISKQDKEGSWGSIDMTSTGIQALKSFENITGVNDSISKAENYLISKQEKDGGFENSFSTSWVLQSMFGSDKILKTENYLISKQEDDGGMGKIKDDINSRIWATAYTIPAILHKPWSEILNNFPKPMKKEIIKKTVESLVQNAPLLENQDTNNKNIISPTNNNFWSKLKNSFKQFLIHLKF